jgi:hypothetical protein
MLAYIDEAPVGWCGLGPRAEFTRFQAAGFRRIAETGARSAGLPRVVMRLDLTG